MPFAYELDELFVGLGGGDGGTQDYDPETPRVGEELAHKRLHALEGVDRLLEQFKRKPLLEGALVVQLDEIQQLEDALWQLLTERWLDTSSGEQLDTIGRVVGLERDANDDQAFRLLLAVEILSLRSSGTGEQLLVMATQLFGAGGFELLDADDLGPSTHATALIRVLDRALPLPPAFYMRLFRRAAAAGVRVLLEYLAVDPATTFTFSSSAAVEVDPAHGFGSVTDPTIGGRFGGVTA